MLMEHLSNDVCHHLAGIFHSYLQFTFGLTSIWRPELKTKINRYNLTISSALLLVRKNIYFFWSVPKTPLTGKITFN